MPMFLLRTYSVLRLAIQDSQDPQQQEVGTLDLGLEGEVDPQLHSGQSKVL